MTCPTMQREHRQHVGRHRGRACYVRMVVPLAFPTVPHRQVVEGK